MRKLLFALLLLFLFAAPALAEVKVTTSTKYYSVSGTTQNSILRNMKKKSPLIEGGLAAAALTETQLKFKYSWRKVGTRCTMDKVTIHLHLTYTYPKLAQKQSKSVSQWWKKQMSKFIDHEKTHGKISKKWAKVIDRELGKLRNVQCATVKSSVQSKTQYYSRKLKDEQKKFDRITDHGRNDKRYRVR